MLRSSSLISGLSLLVITAAVARGEEHSVVASQPIAHPSNYDHASTFFEGYMRGAADWERADGEWLLHYSQARVNMEEARRRAGENHAAEVRSYFQLREENRRWRAAERHPVRIARPQSPTVTRAKKSAPAAQPAPFQIAENGRVEWPRALRVASFAGYRVQVEQFLAERRAGKRLSMADRENVQTVRQSMLDELKTRISEIPTPDYLAAAKCIKMLTSLDTASNAAGQLADK